ncbi:MAG: acetyl-CoA carboxylase biotin carboxylase subunit [Gammaproteobacteria bacterium]|nr:acetyl-CoA carboxylase biotin carboxylase subunit [Gammaproteobacteria bacterium]
MFSTLLIANRGEIACRIIQTAKQLGIRTVAVYSTVDSNSLHVKLADDAFCIGEPTALLSYLNIDKVIEAALAAGADAIHPGYGFLSENPAFAKACAVHNITFVGPSVNAMELMASKQRAKHCLEKTNVPLTPGYHGSDQTLKALQKAACNIGFPVLLKAASGGGGKGMRAVTKEAEFEKALEGAKREAKASFDDDTMLIEKLIVNPRHVEIQLMADNHGNVVHLFERDCSIQRRHQKVIEEAPAPNLPKALRSALADAAITVAKTIDYQGAGTVEFLVDTDNTFYFMEMNTRLQVEHPVTEMITGLDLVEWQLRIAAGEKLPLMQNKIQQNGHAIECRVYAEDTSQGGLPSTGTLRVFEEPKGRGIRLDSGFQDGDTITRFYDPMLGKLIAFGDTREEALKRLGQAINHYHLGGVKTNLAFLGSLLEHPAFKTIQLNTAFLTEHTIKLPEPSVEDALMFAASMTFLTHLPTQENTLLKDTFSWQLCGRISWPLYYEIDSTRHTIQLTPITFNQFEYLHADKRQILTITYDNNLLTLNTGVKRLDAYTEIHEKNITFHTHQGAITVTSVDNPSHSTQTKSTENSLNAPMPATVVAVLKQKGDSVQAGDDLMVLEAMKMEHTIRAPQAGQLIDIFYPIGAQVDEGVALLALSPLNTSQNEEV